MQTLTRESNLGNRVVRRSAGFRVLSALCLAGGIWALDSASAQSATSPAEGRRAAIYTDLDRLDLQALQRAIRDLTRTFPDAYVRGPEYLRRAEQYASELVSIRQRLADGDANARARAEEIVGFQREALLANPLLNFDRLLLIRRKPIGDPRRAAGDPGDNKSLGKFLGLPQQTSWQLHTMPNPTGWDNEIAVLSPVRPEGTLQTLYRPSAQELISEMDLHFEAAKLMFSMPDSNRFWQVFELDLEDHELRQVTGHDQPDVHHLDSCYLPDGRIVCISTAAFQGVPCNAGVNVGMTYLMNADGKNMRQICFEQDHNFCPTVMNDGRLLYLRWEYTDIPHVWARFLFTMNPDGTGQREYYGSGSYWPNAIFWARPIPDHPTKIVGIVTGHHVGRVGELVIFDPPLGRRSTQGVVQRIPGFGQTVEPLIQDKLTLHSWPKFLHPWPLSENYFIVACKPAPDDLWGIYLVDVFDNFVLLKELPGHALLEPIPLRPIRKPPVIPDQVRPGRTDALVYVENVYHGPGLKDVPQGAVRRLRLFTYHFAYRTVAGINHRVGTDGPWEPKRVLGTVPVEADGSAFFHVPANTPISIQPLDDDNQALQLMRSWTTAMPGEFVSCTGCHENLHSAPPNLNALAIRRSPSEIAPWYGPERGFSFIREVQPLLDRYCVGCHHDKPHEPTMPDLRGDQGKFVVYRNADPKGEVISGVPRDKLVTQYGGVFDPSYVALRRHVRVGGLESDLRQLHPAEFHANTTELMQMLRKGHHGVVLDEEAWDRLATWIDLNAPCHGTWTDVVGRDKLARDCRRRIELRGRYGGSAEDPETVLESPAKPAEPIVPSPPPRPPIQTVHSQTWPFDRAEAQRRQSKLDPARRSISLGEGVGLSLVLVPAGDFVMGDPAGHPDESPPTLVRIERPFWIGRFEVSNEQYARFDPTHDSRFEDKGSWMFNEWDLGWPLNRPQQPVVRVSFQEAMAFCRWLSLKTGEPATLPTEAQWEYVCRAGSASPFHYGDLDTDFAPHANMADFTIRNLAYDCRDQFPPDLVPRDARFNDGALVTAQVGTYQPNAWGLHDLHGNVWEWTRSAYQPYPYDEQDGRNESAGTKVVRGGSWYDRPARCRSAYRLSYPPWQKVYNVGFRVLIPADERGR